jgi:tetratricopeptide (TPR) repeat protein
VAAKSEYEQALALKKRALPAGHPDIGKTYYSLANAETALGHGPAALAAADQAVAMYRAAYGNKKPLIWEPLLSRGEAFQLLGRLQEAESDFRVSLEGAEALFGVEHAWTAIVLHDLGTVLMGRGKLREAIPVLDRTLKVRERLEPNQESVAETRFALGRALWQAEDDRPRALALGRTARDEYAKLPGHERQIAAIDTWLKGRQRTGG